MNVWSLVRPNLLQLAIWVILLALLLSVATQRIATSKVTWEETRGIPLAFATFGEYRGPCGPEGDFCVKFGVQSLYPFPLALDILILYLTSCIVSFALHRVAPAIRLPNLG